MSADAHVFRAEVVGFDDETHPTAVLVRKPLDDEKRWAYLLQPFASGESPQDGFGFMVTPALGQWVWVSLGQGAAIVLGGDTGREADRVINNHPAPECGAENLNLWAGKDAAITMDNTPDAETLELRGNRGEEPDASLSIGSASAGADTEWAGPRATVGGIEQGVLITAENIELYGQSELLIEAKKDLTIVTENGFRAKATLNATVKGDASGDKTVKLQALQVSIG